MTHVKIDFKEYAGSLTLNGVDLSRDLLFDGLRVEFVEEGDGPRQARVHVVIAADVLEVDLAEALLIACREDDRTA